LTKHFSDKIDALFCLLAAAVGAYVPWNPAAKTWGVPSAWPPMSPRAVVAPARHSESLNVGGLYKAPVIILRITAVLVLTIASEAIVALGGAAPVNTIDLAYNEVLGEYLVDQDGMTLYYSVADVPDSGKSSCGDTCTHYWPPFHTGQIVINKNLSWFDFDTIYRDDGSAQITYKGWPLYYYTNDYSPGEIRGQGIDGVWFVAGPRLMP